MGVFGIGPLELFLVLVVALVVFGPARLPEIAGGIGRAIREFRKISAELTAEVTKVTEELTEIKSTVTQEVEEVKQAATVTLDSESSNEQTPGSAAEAPAIVPSERVVAQTSANSSQPVTDGSFEEQVVQLMKDPSTGNGYVNGHHDEDPFQTAVLELKRADGPEVPATGSDTGSAASEVERGVADDEAKSAAPPSLPMQWYSGT